MNMTRLKEMITMTNEPKEIITMTNKPKEMMMTMTNKLKEFILGFIRFLALPYDMDGKWYEEMNAGKRNAMFFLWILSFCAYALLPIIIGNITLLLRNILLGQ